MKKSSKSKNAQSTVGKSEIDKTDAKQIASGEDKKVDAKGQPQKWSDLDKYIELLLDSKSEEETVFVYLNPNPNRDPYDLLVCSYQ
jgi:hypothetical protein